MRILIVTMCCGMALKHRNVNPLPQADPSGMHAGGMREEDHVSARVMKKGKAHDLCPYVNKEAEVASTPVPLFKKVPAPILGNSTIRKLENITNAIVTVLAGKDYLPGLYIMAQSLREHSDYPLIVLVVDGSMDFTTSERKTFDKYLLCLQFVVAHVPEISNPYTNTGRYSAVMSKLWAFGLPVKGRLLFMDLDVVAVRSPDKLFTEMALSPTTPIRVAADCGYRCHTGSFNSGVILLKPSSNLFESLMAELGRLPSGDKSDQGFLNSFFKDAWRGGEIFLDQKYNKLKRREGIDGNFSNGTVLLHAVGQKPWTHGGELLRYPKTQNIFNSFAQKFFQHCEGQITSVSVKAYRCALQSWISGR